MEGKTKQVKPFNLYNKIPPKMPPAENLNQRPCISLDFLVNCELLLSAKGPCPEEMHIAYHE